MAERIYTAHPDLYDAIQSEWDYDRDLAFLEAAIERNGVTGERLLEIGCGTGEHTRRFVDRGSDVTAVDKYDGMLDRAREKTNADFRQQALPTLPDGQFDVIVAIRGVINHLPPDDLTPALEAITDRLADGGIVVFDNASLPEDGNQPALDVGETEYGSYGRIVQMAPREDGRLDWQSIVCLPDENEWFVNSRAMTPFADDRIESVLDDCGYSVTTHEGFDDADSRTVFVSTRQ
jgi:SAM-dependent methyltransferase